MKLHLLLLGVFALFTFALGQRCNPGYFECDNGYCIDLGAVCDGYNDCGDGSDEPEDTTQCPTCEEKDYFECANGKCLYKSFVCDGYDDCGDNSDEPEDPDHCLPCKDHEFRCNNGRCVHGGYVCDGKRNCWDGSDETEDACPCTEDEYRCQQPVAPPGEHNPPGRCIPPDWFCDADSIRDCPLGDDELNCTVL